MLDRLKGLEPLDDAPRDAPLPDAPPGGASETAKLPTLEIFTAASLGDDEPPARRWHVHKLIPAGEITLLSGDGGTGKSLLGLQLALATATGGDWIATLPERGRALVVSAEDAKDELHRRLANIARRKGRRLSEIDGLDLVSLAGRDAVLAAPGRDGNLAPTLLFQALRARIEQTRPDLIVLDTLADLFGGDEIKRAHARQFVGILRGLAIDFGATVLLLAHPSKDGLRSDDGTSGSTAWNNSVRSRLYLKRPRANDEDDDSDDRVLTTKKSNYGRAGEERVLRWRDGVFVPQFEASGDKLVANAADEQTFMDCLAEFERTGRHVSPHKGNTYAPSVFTKHPTAKNLSGARIAAAMERLFSANRIHTTTVGPPSKARQHIAAGPAPSKSNEGV